MCDFSHGGCCPPAQIVKEKICGNLNNNSETTFSQTIWISPPGDYIQGNFQVFNSAASTGNIAPSVNGLLVPLTTATPGNTVGRTVMNPTSFNVTLEPGSSGTYCMTLYKRVLA